VLVKTVTTAQSLSTATDILTIGTLETADSQFFNGQIDDVRIYNYALTSYQVKTLYNENSAVRFGPLTGSP
jgi:hypothetical protein